MNANSTWCDLLDEKAISVNDVTTVISFFHVPTTYRKTSIANDNINYLGADYTTSALSQILDSCIKVNSTGSAPWNNPADLVNVQVQILFNNVKAMIILPIFFFFSAPTNILSMVVFAKHGLSHRTNVCLFTLSLVDLLYGVISFCMYVEQLWSNLLTDPPYFGGVTQFITSQHVLGFYGFGWVSMWLTGITAVERCLCVMFPLRFETFLKVRTLWLIICTGTLIILVGAFAVSEKYQVVCAFDVNTRTSRMILFASDFYVRHRDLVDMLELIVLGLLWPLFAVVTVTIATSVTAVTLTKAITWRQESSSNNALMSRKEIALTKMLIWLSLRFIIFNIPNILFRIVGITFPDLSNYGRFYNLYFVLLGVVEIMTAINTSLNFFIYFLTGTKYRETVMAMFKKSRKQKKGIFAQTKISHINTL